MEQGRIATRFLLDVSMSFCQQLVVDPSIYLSLFLGLFLSDLYVLLAVTSCSNKITQDYYCVAEEATPSILNFQLLFTLHYIVSSSTST